MHPVREGSDLARINSAAPGEITSIHASTSQVLRLALRLHALTGGVFDPALPLKRGRLADLELDFAPGGAPQVICRAPVALDFGGIAKGYAIDRAIAALVAAGCRAGLVNVGGDLRLFGSCGQTILLRGPDGSYQPLELMNTALAVSDCDANRRPSEHRGYYLRTGAPRARRRYAAVLARDAMTADALTKCALLCREACAQDVLREFDAREAA
jgi:thiamine biosynthesis lipoprotein